MFRSIASNVVKMECEQGLRPVLVAFDDCSQFGLEVERQDDSAVAVYLPGAPNPWSGTVVLTRAEKISALPVSMMATLQTLQQMGKGANALIAGLKPSA